MHTELPQQPRMFKNSTAFRFVNVHGHHGGSTYIIKVGWKKPPPRSSPDISHYHLIITGNNKTILKEERVVNSSSHDITFESHGDFNSVDVEVYTVNSCQMRSASSERITIMVQDITIPGESKITYTDQLENTCKLLIKNEN